MSCSKAAPSSPHQRFCSFCLNSIDNVLKCGKCHRRAYCSKECQTADWKRRKDGKPTSSPKAACVGQGHKDWCSLTCGEEGLDWAIREIPSKGRGIVALRDLPPLYRILVEGYQRCRQFGLHDHPGFKYLSDSTDYSKDNANEDPERKFTLNAVGSGDGTVLGLRLSLVNHDCDANAAFTDDEGFKTLILYSLKPIKEGEEICYQYERFNDVRRELSDPSTRALTLKLKWGIECPESCCCKDAFVRSKLVELKRLDKSLEFLCASGRSNEAISRMFRILELGDEASLPANIMSSIHFWAFELHCSRRRTVASGMPFIRKVVEFHEAVYHPCSYKEVVKFKEMEADPTRVVGYCGGD